MKYVKRLSAALLAVIMLLTVTGCHKKDEIAVKIGEWEFTSAYYMCTLIYADTKARNTIDTQLAEKNEDSDTASTEEVDYLKQKIDDMSFSDWVKQEAMNELKRIAAYKTKCKEADLKLEDEVVTNAEQYAEYYWTYNGYQSMFEPNGVSKSTFVEYLTNSYYSTLYFEHLYCEGGEREIAKDEVQAKIMENYVVADIINVSYETDATDDDKAALKAKFDNYANSLTNGTMTFDQVYTDYYGESETTTDTTTDAEAEEGTAPIDSKAQILGSSDTSYASDYYETVNSMAIGIAQTVASSDSKGLTLLFKKDLTADPYYFKTLDSAGRQLITGEALEDEMEEFGGTLEFEENTRNTGLFKVKNIVYPEATSTTATA